MIAEPSWAELRAQATTTPKKIVLELLTLHLEEQPYAKFINLVERGIDYSIQDMVRQKDVLQSESEDQLSILILGYLKGMTFDASHDKNTGGHCDIVVDGPDEMLWLGEAKKYTSYPKLLGGFRQLMDRYATGMPNQCTGGMIIYSFARKSKEVMDRWKAYLCEAEPVTVEDVPDRPLEFRSIRDHAGTQQAITVRHTPVVLFHEPTDTKKAPPRSPKAKAA